MPLPTDGMSRLRPEAVEAAELARFVALAIEIEARECPDEARFSRLLAEWNHRAHRAYEPVEFKAYAGSMDTEQFAREALMKPATYIDDLRFGEACAAMAAISDGELSEAETSAVLQALEANFPAADVSELIYWPNTWFGDDALIHVELSPEQLVGYASARSGRSLANAPGDLELPIPAPPRRGSIRL